MILTERQLDILDDELRREYSVYTGRRSTRVVRRHDDRGPVFPRRTLCWRERWEQGTGIYPTK